MKYITSTIGLLIIIIIVFFGGIIAIDNIIASFGESNSLLIFIPVFISLAIVFAVVFKILHWAFKELNKKAKL